jgi:cyclohexanecarboxylate-CoA ligase
VSATPFVVDLITAQQDVGASLESFRYFVCGGAPIPPHVVSAAAEALDCELVAVWGMTENGVVTSTAPGSPIEVVANSDGVPVPWMQLRVVDEDGAELPVGETGRLQVRGPSQALGYFRRPDVYAASCTADGWFDTGDLAWRRDDGGIRISGRAKDLVIRGGENVPVAEVEAVLYTHGKVRELAVIGLPDDRLGERACAVVVPEDESDPPTLAELVRFLDEAGMAKQYWPERLEVVAAMPRTPSGKIQKFLLREQFGAR